MPAPPPPYPDQRDGFLRLDGLTTALTTLFIAVAVVAASSIGALANQRRVIDRIRAGRDVRLSEADDADTLVGAVLLIEVLIGVAIFVLIIVWLWRAYGNIVALGAEPTRYGRGFTIGAWFIPIAAWFIPKQLINDTWRAAAPEAPGNPRWTKLPIPKVCTAWWLLYLAAMLMFPQAFSGPDADIDDVSRAINVGIVDAVLVVAASICGALTFRRTSARQHAAVARHLKGAT